MYSQSAASLRGRFPFPVPLARVVRVCVLVVALALALVLLNSHFSLLPGVAATTAAGSATALSKDIQSLGKLTWENLTDYEEYSLYSDMYVHDVYHSGLRKLAAKAETAECRNAVEFEYMKYIRAIAEETAFPFEEVMFHSQCDHLWTSQPPMLPLYTKEIPQRPPLPPVPTKVNRTIAADDLSILYILLVHDWLEFSKRIFSALNEPMHTFIIHVDLKSPHVHKDLSEWVVSSNLHNVHVMQIERVDMVWGAYSIVNGTINAMRLALNLNISFDYVALVSGTSYPLKSNQIIRETLAKDPNAIYMDVHTEPSRPGPDMWHHYVECDGKLNRIGRLAPLRGINMYTGSQWFIIPKHLMAWFINDPLPYELSFYFQYIVVADENYFQTLTRNSPYCLDIVMKNHLFVLFDKWENERNAEKEKRDSRKCLHPDPDQCGRSPTTLTTAYKNLLKISRALFARKFDPNVKESAEMLDIIDGWRKSSLTKENVGDEGSEVMIRLKPTGKPSKQKDKCLEFTSSGAGATMTLCDASNPDQWFLLGPCTDNSNFTLADGSCPVLHSEESDTFCQIQSSSRNLCLDISGENPNDGALLIGWECTGQWNQLFRIGSNCSLGTVQPDLIARVRGNSGAVNITKCVEVSEQNTLETAQCASADFIKNISQTNPKEALQNVFKLRNQLNKQQFEFLKASEVGYRIYGRHFSSKIDQSSVSPSNSPTEMSLSTHKAYNEMPTTLQKAVNKKDKDGKKSNKDKKKSNKNSVKEAKDEL